MPMPSAAPEPPSPITMQTIGVRIRDISSRLVAISWAWPRSSAPIPGYAPGVSIRQMIGSLYLAARPHAAERLAVALGMSAAVETLVALLEVVSLLMADEHDAIFGEAREAGADGPVVADRAVAVQLDKFVEDHGEVIAGLRPIRMPA